jgi:hypothetical protein
MFLACIIAVDGVVRNSNLVGQLRALEVFSDVVIVEAKTPKIFGQKFLELDRRISSRIVGREVSDVEIAIKRSHLECYAVGQSRKVEKLFVVEDDAQISDINKLKVSLLAGPVRSGPVIFSFFSPEWSVWKLHKGQWQAKFPPAGAVAYSISSDAIDLALSAKSFGLADWPTWAKNVSFYLKADTGISHPNLSSFPGIEREKYIETSFQFHKRLLNLVYDERSDIFLMSIWYPFLWKISVLYKWIFTHRKLSSKQSIFMRSIFRS